MPRSSSSKIITPFVPPSLAVASCVWEVVSVMSLLIQDSRLQAEEEKPKASALSPWSGSTILIKASCLDSSSVLSL